MFHKSVTSRVKASHPFIRISPYKLRRVVDLIRGKDAFFALEILKNIPHKGARIAFKVLKSAIANAQNNFHLDTKKLILAKVFVNEGPKLKRFKPRARGRIFQILKRTSHLTIELGES